MMEDLEKDLVTINFKLHKAYQTFLQDYLHFFGSDTPLDLFITTIICEKICQLFTSIDTLVHEKQMLLEPREWYNKHPFIGACAFEDPEEI